MPLLRLQIHPQRFRGRRLIRALRRSGAVLACLVAVYFLAALIGGLVPGRAVPTVGSETRQIVLVNGPIHYDILIPIDVARRDMGWLAAQGLALDHTDVRWLLVGWGARDFYTATGTYGDVSLRAIWRGVTGDSSVMRVSVVGAIDDHWPRLALDAVQMRRLTTAVTANFAGGASAAPLDHPGFSDFDRFFPSEGRFHLFNTCNVWVGDTLRSAGLRFGLWTPTPYAVTMSYRLFHGD